MVVIDTHLARGASNGGVTFHNQGGPTVGPTARNGSSASTLRACHSACESYPLRTPTHVPSNRYSTTFARSGADERLELVLVDRGTAQSAAQRLSNKFNYEVRRVGWDEPPRNEHGAKVFRPIRHAWRVEVAQAIIVRRVWRAASKTP